MSDIGKAFDEKFGLTGLEMFPKYKRSQRSPKKNAVKFRNSTRIELSPFQKSFCEYLSLDAYTDNGDMLYEFIVKLTQECGSVVLKEIRLLDFARIERYITEINGKMSDPIEGHFKIHGNWSSLKEFTEDGYYRIKWRFKGKSCDVELDSNVKIRKLSAKDIVKCKYNAAKNMSAGTAKDISKLHDTLDKQLQEAGEDVFIYELLQNANDYPCGNEKVDAEFRICQDEHCSGYLAFCHTGSEFSATFIHQYGCIC